MSHQLWSELKSDFEMLCICRFACIFWVLVATMVEEDVKKALTVTWQDGTADDSWDGCGQMKAAEDG